MGDTTKVDDQERICRDLAHGRRWHVPREFVWKDNNVSAWRRDRSRPGWDAMLAAVKAGEISNLVVYHGDRLVRQPFDLEVLIKLVDQGAMTIASPTGTRDLSDPTDRFALRVLVAQACMESDNISRRKKAGFERMRLKGIAPVPGGQGHRAFGYQHDGSTLHPAEAEAVRSAARRLLDGETLAAVCRDLTEAGITSTTGAPLTYSTLRRILLRPRTAGLLADGSKGNWKPVLEPAVQRELAGLFTAAPPREPAGGRYLLSGIALCWACKRTVQSAVNGGQRAYGCVTHGCRRAYRNMALLDAYITGRVVGLLNSDAVTEQMPEPPEDDATAGQIAALERRRDEALDTLGSLPDHPGASAAMLARSVREFEQRIAVLRAQHSTPGQRALSAHAGLTVEEFGDLPLGMRRQLVRAAYRITLLPARRGPGFREEDVEVVLRED